MTERHRFTPHSAGAMAALAMMLATPAAAKPALQVIYQAPVSGDPLIATFANADGSVFVETPLGQNGRGQILVLTPKGKTYKSSVVKAFNCDTDGAQPSGVLVADEAGNVWGTTNSGCGANGNPNGTIFELVKPQQGGSWTFQTVLQMPASIAMSGALYTGYEHMAFDNRGDLFGLVYPTCSQADGCGKIFRVPAAALNGSKPKAKVKILYTWPYNPSDLPTGGLVMDKQGNLFGTDDTGGAAAYGAVWEVSPPTTKTGPWTRQNIYEFCTQTGCPDGYNPEGVLAIDKNGDLYGTAIAGGSNQGYGTIWSMTPNGGNGWSFRTLHVLNWDNPCQVVTDQGVANPTWNTLLDQKGQILTFVNQGGYFDVCGNFGTPIWGGMISVDPSSGADAIVSNQFAALGHVSGPYAIESSPSISGNTVFGTSQFYYDAGSDTYTPGVVFRITQ
jgi:hypothetical protein